MTSPGDVLLVDPSLFTAPYDAALSRGLEANGVRARWATRGLRVGEDDEIGSEQRLGFFYPTSDGPRRRANGGWRGLKGVEHALGMRRLVSEAADYALVHFQWLLLPLIDARVMRRLRRRCPVVLTVHDTTPFNGKAVSRLQRAGLSAALNTPDRIIVHTAAAVEALAAQGVRRARIAVVPHGPLATSASPIGAPVAGERWRVVLFGKLQDYKGIDVLVEALGQLDPVVRERLSVTIAGEPLIDVAPLQARAVELGLSSVLDWRLHRHTPTEMTALFEAADAFVFPYRAIEASGVLHLVAPLGRWLVASDLPGFAALIGRDDAAGQLVAPGDAGALAAALTASIGRRPTRDLGATLTDWTTIGRMTRTVYDEAHAAWRGPRALAA